MRRQFCRNIRRSEHSGASFLVLIYIWTGTAGAEAAEYVQKNIVDKLVEEKVFFCLLCTTAKLTNSITFHRYICTASL